MLVVVLADPTALSAVVRRKSHCDCPKRRPGGKQLFPENKKIKKKKKFIIMHWDVN